MTRHIAFLALLLAVSSLACSGDTGVDAGPDVATASDAAPDATADSAADAAVDSPVDRPSGPDAANCTMAGQCPSGFCIDGVCCASKCTDACYACNLPGTAGTCAPVTGAEDKDTCTGAKSCSATGACKAKVGEVCKAATECASGYCADGFCCNAACDGMCQSCHQMGKLGVCTPVTNQNDLDHCVEGNTCDATGLCKRVAGAICTTPTECATGLCKDGVCCRTACTEACKRCDDAASPGTCVAVVSEPDLDTCTATGICDALGTCKQLDGQACGSAASCLSGNCVDGVCCNLACSGPCAACNLAGSVGTCAPITSTDDPDMCTGMSTCGPTGSCGKKNGQPCGSASETCASGICENGFCCGALCGACFQCNGAGTEGTCTPTPQGGYDPPAGCHSAQACDGLGTCKVADGYPCSTDGQCAAGVCTVFTVDADRDGFGSQNAGPGLSTKACGTKVLPDGYGPPTDCCDMDINVRPDPPGYVPTPSDYRTTPVAKIGCETTGFDWNCDGVNDSLYTKGVSCFYTEFGCGGAGWVGVTPACGIASAYTGCEPAGGMTCIAQSPPFIPKTQACR